MHFESLVTSTLTESTANECCNEYQKWKQTRSLSFASK